MTGDSYRPAPRPRPPPPLADRVTFTSGGGDSYRPGPAPDGNSHNHREFTFSSGQQAPSFAPTGPAADSKKKKLNPRRRNKGGRGGSNNNDDDDGQRAFERTGMSQYNGGRRQYGRGRGGFRPYRGKAPHERKLLQTRDGASPEHTLGVETGVNKFRDLDDLSRSEEEMDIGSDASVGDGSEGDGQEDRYKMPRVQSSTRADGDSVPKWSNPDPYTVLPPPNETTGKKIDFVQLIRKAKNQAAEKSVSSNAVAANDDFISFGEDEERLQPAILPPPPRALRPSTPPPPPPPAWQGQGHGYPLMGSMNDVAATGALAAASQDAKRSTEAAGLPVRPQLAGRTPKRKRGQFEGGLIAEWLPHPYASPVPWCRNVEYGSSISKQSGSPYDQMLKLLHNEVLDFYDFVAPHDDADRVRNDLIDRIQQVLGNLTAVFGDQCLVHCFGSYPQGLYLPTADMDLVLVTQQHINGGPRMLDFEASGQVNKALRAAANKLRSAGIATNVQIITKAKVPLVKFVDRRSSVKVDLSFENLTGVEAQHTFKKWKEDYTDMTAMVALVKQFLLMRGLNDVHTGGLGGLSIICLVILVLYREGQMVKSKKLKGNVGRTFLNFLDFYGNHFNLATQRIVMEPHPHVVTKLEWGIDGRREKPDGLSIQDPNNPINNVSGGSHRARLVFEVFADAHKALQDRLSTLDLSGTSILQTVIGGNYDPYSEATAHMTRLSNTSRQF